MRPAAGGAVTTNWPRRGGRRCAIPGSLKLFFGGDPAGLASGQLRLHRDKLAEYEALAEQLENHLPTGFMLALRAGIGHEREWVRFWAAVERGETP